MAYVSKDKITLERARFEYLSSNLSLNDTARKHNLKPLNFRRYLEWRNEIKPEHRNKRTRMIKNALQAVEQVQNTELILPKATQAILSDFEFKANEFKGKGLDFALNALNKLNEALNAVDSTDLKEALIIKELANAAKLLSDMLGVYPKAPTIAIQNNNQQILNAQEQKAKKQDLSVIVEVVNDKE